MKGVALVLDGVPDVAGLRLLNSLPAELSDVEVAEYAFQRRRALTAGDSLPPYLQKIAGFACFWRDEHGFHVHSAAGMVETELLVDLFSRLASGGALTCWSEQEASLAALRWRALQAGVEAGACWGCLSGVEALAARFAVDAGETPALASVARLAGLPLEQGTSEELAWRAVQECDWGGMRVRSELRALTAWLLDLRYQTLSGAMTRAARLDEEALLRDWLQQSPSEHLRGFAAAWQI